MSPNDFAAKAGRARGERRAQAARLIGRYAKVRGAGRLVQLLYSPNRRRMSYVETEVEAWDGTKYRVDTRSFLEWSLYVYRAYEADLQRVMMRCLKPGDLFVDCGANVGIHACAMARHVGPTGYVIAIEPIAELADKLERNCALNELRNVSVIRRAASSETGYGRIFVPVPSAANQAQASLHVRPALSTAPRVVEFDTLDNMLAEQAPRPVSLIKIDTEGHELRALQGAVDTIERWRPTLVFEYEPDAYRAAGIEWGEVEEFLKRDLRYDLGQVMRGARIGTIRERAPGAQSMIFGSWNGDSRRRSSTFEGRSRTRA